MLIFNRRALTLASMVRHPFADASIGLPDCEGGVMAQTGTMTAPRTVALCLAAVGNAVIFLDESGTISEANTLTLVAASGDTINGAQTLVLNAPYASAILISDGVSKWTRLQ